MPTRKKRPSKKEEVVNDSSTMSHAAAIPETVFEEDKAVAIATECADGASVLAGLLENLHKDCYSEDEAELQFLYSKPSCFLILGKPGCGKTSLARRFAAEWNCLIINSTDIILENIQLQTEIGLQCVDILTRGGAVTEEMVLKMIEEKVNSTEVAHHGYVLDDFPCLCEDLWTIQDQLELMKCWKLKPDFVINLRIPEKDIEKRRLEQKVDPFTEVIYTKEVYAPDKPILPPDLEKSAAEAEEEMLEDDETIVEEENIIEDNASGMDHPTDEIVKRLVVRPEDMPMQVEKNLAKYRSKMLRCLEDYMGDHDQQYLMELDGNLPVASMFKQLMQKLQTFVLRPAAVVTRLTDPADFDLSDDMDTDDLMRALNSKQMVAPRYRWRRSKWKRNCPVALYEGNVVPGKPEFAVSFLDKLYCLSNAAALEKFMRNPRPYLVPKQPRTPCKLSIVGQPFSGKTTLCHLLAHHYNAKVFDINSLARKQKLEEKRLHILKVQLESTSKAIQQVKNRIKAKLEAERMRRERDRLAIIAAENEALRLEQEREDNETSEGGTKDKVTYDAALPEVVVVSAHSVNIVNDEGGAPVGETKQEVDGEGKSGLATPQEDKDTKVSADSSVLLEEGKDTLGEGIRKDERVSFGEGVKWQTDFDGKYDAEMEEDIELQQVDAFHPEVTAIVEIEISKAKIAPIKVTSEYMAKLLEEAIKQWEGELRSTRHDGPLQGSWILDNYPETAEQWQACIDRNLIPDAVYVLGDEVEMHDTERINQTCERYCLKNKEYFYTEMARREAEKELDKQKAALEAQQKKFLEEENIKKEMHEEAERQRIIDEELRVAEAARQEARGKGDRDATTADTIPRDDDDSSLATPVQVSSTVLDEDGEYGEDEGDSETDSDLKPPIKTELDILMEQPEAKMFIDKLLQFENTMALLEAAIVATSNVIPLRIKIEGYPIEEVLETVIKNEERPYKYMAWEMEQVDHDEMEEDIEAENLLETDTHEPTDGKKELEEEDEDPNRGMKKFLGETNYFDPVDLKDKNILYPGNAEVAAMYREKMYYFSSEDNREYFIKDPTSFLQEDTKIIPPPLRLLMLGPKGAGKSENSNYLSDKLGIFHISFRELLQELIIAKTKKKIGPEFEPELDDSMLDESDSQSQNIRDEGVRFTENNRSADKFEIADSRFASKQGLVEPIPEEEEEVELTENEEAIKANLESNEPLPVELLESILKPYWTLEPFISTGFILEGFPRTTEEARFMQEAGFFPDAAISLQTSEDDIIGRMLPPKIALWKARRAKRVSMKARHKAKMLAKRIAAIAKRKEILMKERDEKRAAKKRESRKTIIEEEDEAEDEEEEVEEEEEEDIDAILAEEFEEEEEEQEEEDEREEDAIERMKNDITEMFVDDNERLAGVMETLEEILIPRLNIPAGRKPHIVRYIINKKLKPFVEHRSSMFERVFPVSEQLARRMLQTGYKQPSRFGRWDPVQLKEGKCIQPITGPDNPSFACVYRSYIYYLSSLSNRLSFMQDPVNYLYQESPKAAVPLRIAIIGPPKSGKTTLANRFVEDYGVVRLSIGEALRYNLAQHPTSELSQKIKWHLIRGRVVPEELEVQALDVALLDVRCQTRGYVLDGYPMTLRQVELMTELNIIPVRIIELELSSKEVLVRGVKDRLAATRTMALHDSTQILAIKLSCYQRFVSEVREWYKSQYRNHHTVAADQSKWWVLDAVHEVAISSIKRIQDYIHRTAEGRAAGIAGLCITLKEFQARIGVFGQYCPVNLAEWNYLVDCSFNKTLEFAAEFRGQYYKMAGPKELEMFLANPEKYIPPNAPYTLPPPEELPQKIPKEELLKRQPEILGYCPVTYLDGNLRYEALVPGNPSFAAEYKGKVYLMENEEKLIKFMKEPEKYANLTLPHKLPPAPEDMPLQNLPMLGFMEQTCAIAMIKALTAAGNVKPKYPFISSTRSALIYIAYHLKAFNPKSSPYIRKKYKQKLQQFQETCELIKYLGNNMTVRYRDPNERPKDFDNKLETFFALRGIEPTPTWLK